VREALKNIRATLLPSAKEEVAPTSQPPVFARASYQEKVSRQTLAEWTASTRYHHPRRECNSAILYTFLPSEGAVAI